MAKNRAYEAGLAVRKRVLGEAHVDRAIAGASAFDREWQDFVTLHAWGAVWTRPGLEPRIRSILTIAILAVLGREEELRLHLRATRNTGATRDEIREALMQVAVYAGVPAANAAFRIAKAALAEIDSEAEARPARKRARAKRGTP